MTSPARSRSRLRRGLGVAASLALPLSLGCADSSGAGGAGSGTGGAVGTTCKLPNLGDPTQDIQLDLVELDANQSIVTLAEGADVDLVTPPQGGRVVFVGVHATNLSPCGVTLAGSLKDTASGKLMLDSRTVNLKVGTDGYGSSVDSNISTFANIPVCPNQWSSVNAFDVPYELTVKLTDAGGRSASKTLHVTPRCAETGMLKTECTCICKAGYVLGQPCP